ncbi:MAG: AAA family ATPase [Saprospiraceae bacterium]
MTNSNNNNSLELLVSPPPYHFILTKEYQRFEEFCIACLEEKYIGICYGRAGVGKTLSARHFAHWNLYLNYSNPNYIKEFKKKELRVLSKCNTFFYTAPVLAAPKRTRAILMESLLNFAYDIQQINQQLGKKSTPSIFDVCKLVIIDEADRLKLNTLEELRDFYDFFNVGLILIGMPGLEKRLSRFPQFFSRIGFAHEFKLLENNQAQSVVEHFLSQKNMKIQDNQNKEVIATIIRITNGNFRLIERLFRQIKRILKINQILEINTEVVLTAKDCLVIGNS